MGDLMERKSDCIPSFLAPIRKMRRNRLDIIELNSCAAYDWAIRWHPERGISKPLISPKNGQQTEWKSQWYISASWI